MSLERVAGQKDPEITILRELLTEQGRRKHGLFFVEGQELVNRAFDYGAGVRSVILTDRFAASDRAGDIVLKVDRFGIPGYTATEGLLAKALEAKPTPECLAIADRTTCSLDESLSGGCPLVIMVEHCENADNLGMLLRSCDAAGVTGVILAAGTTDPFARRVVRGSRGAVFTLPVCILDDPLEAVEQAGRRGIRVVACSARADMDYTSNDFSKPSVIIVGNEHTGVSEAVRRSADAVVRIPMLGRINSLNIAAAASVVLYEAVRQRA